MSGKIFGLALAAALMGFASQAEARRLFWWEARPSYDNSYSYDDPTDPSVDPYADPQDADVQDMFNQEQYDLYVREMQRKHRLDYGRDRYDPALYDQGTDNSFDPQGDSLRPPVKKPIKPKKPKLVTVAKSAPDSTGSVKAAPAQVQIDPPSNSAAAASLSPVTTANAAESKPQIQPPKAAKSGKVTCAKGEEIVASYGFLDISQKSCEGSSLVYSAVRGKSNFEVEINPASGEVTAVRKLS